MEPRIVGVSITCKNEIKVNGKNFREFVLTWPKQEDVTDFRVHASIFSIVDEDCDREDEDTWFLGKLGENPRNYNVKNTHLVGFQGAVIRCRGKEMLRMSAQDFFERGRKWDDDDL